MRPYRHLPSVIQTALLRLETHPTFRSVTKSALKVLKALVTRASSTNGEALIRARLETVAFQANVSTKTTQRALHTFGELGWVMAASEGRSEYGVFTSKRYVFSPQFCALVHLPTTDKPAAALAQETEMSDGAIYVDLNFKKDHREILLQNRLQNPEANPITLPAALHPIIELGVKDTGVCKLRGMAHAAGHDLVDIFTVAKKRLSDLKASGGRVYCYLAALIAKPSDYAARAAQIERSGVVEAVKSYAKARSVQYAHKRFTAGPGIIVRIFDGIAEVIRNGMPAGSIAGRDMERVYDDIDSGKLKEVPQ